MDERAITAVEVASVATATTPTSAHTTAGSPRNSAPLDGEAPGGGESGSRPGVVPGGLGFVPLESEEDQAAEEAAAALRESSGTFLVE